MSSHHIIREDQEPALLIDAHTDEDLESIQQLLEWSPTVIVTEQALEQVLRWGTKIDVVIALEAHLEELRITLTDQLPLKILSCNSATEVIDTALYFLTDSKQKAVNVISDSSLESFEKFSALDVAVIQKGKRWVLIRTGNFEKWLPAGTAVETYPKGFHSEAPLEKDGIIALHRNHSFWIAED